MSEVVRGVRVVNDYGAKWPLWLVGEGRLATPEELGLTEDLTVTIREWSAFFNAHFDHLSGWDSPESRAHHAVVAEDVTHRLRAELGAAVPVEMDLWELA